jgi:hypothetical protein
VKFNLEWVKKHPYVVAGGVLAVLVVLYLVSRNSSSGGGFAGALAAQSANQANAAQINAQLSAQSEQTQAQLASEAYSVQAQNQQQQNALVGSIAETVLPIQYESSLYEQEIAAAAAEQKTLAPYIGQALNISTQGNRAQTGQNELALLLGASNPSLVGYAGGLPIQGAKTTSPSSLGLSFNGLTLGGTLGTGLFG